MFVLGDTNKLNALVECVCFELAGLTEWAKSQIIMRTTGLYSLGALHGKLKEESRKALILQFFYSRRCEGHQDRLVKNNIR